MKLKYASLTYFNSLLLLSAIILIGLSFISDNSWNNLELNLGTELTGIFLTITVIDWIIKRNNEKKWEKSKNLLFKKVIKVNNKFNSSIREFSGIKTKIPIHKKPYEENIIKFNIKLLELTEKDIMPLLQYTILSFPPIKWVKLFNNLRELNEYLIQTIFLFGDKIDPNIHSELLSIHINFEEMINEYETFPEAYLYPLYPLNWDQLINSSIIKVSFAEKLKNPLKIAIDMNKKLLNDGYY